MTALNIVYEEEEKRGFIKSSLVALAITAGGVLAVLAAVAGISALSALESLLPGAHPVIVTLAKVLSWLLVAVVGTAAAATIYRYGPSRDKAEWRWLTPGSMLVTVVWGLATFGFGLYVANFASYNATYGSLGAVVVLLMWLYLSAYVLLIGGELNAELEHQTAHDSTAGPEQPLGARGAAMADSVGEVP
jgi:membrane protein